MRRGRTRLVLAAATALALAGCAPKTRYVTPTAASTPAFKENANWKTAQPADTVIRGAWWELFGDERLDRLEEQITVSNESLKAAEAQFTQARAAVRQNRAALYPQVGATPDITGNQQSGNRAFSTYHAVYPDLLLPADASYEPDFWNRLRGTVALSRFAAQASAADLETARLSLHAELAVDYFTLHGLDREQELLDGTVTAYQRALDLTVSRFQGGIASQADVALAQTQLETTRAQAVDIHSQRAQTEHAIAVLVGQAAPDFSEPIVPLQAEAPAVPVGLPSELLERRPDIAAAERRVASANADVGVAAVAYYPRLLLNASGGFEGQSIPTWLTAMSGLWSVGPSMLLTVFDAGQRRAATDQARASYDQAVANYREAVLGSFRDVEDELAELRTLDDETQVQARAVDAAERSLTLATNRYSGGVATYLEVIVAQTAALANERTALDLQIRRLNGTVLLIKALGGGWDISTLPQDFTKPDVKQSAAVGDAK